MKLMGKVAVITGSGIGRRTSILFAEHGAKVVVADINKEAAEETCSIIRKNGKECLAVKVDVWYVNSKSNNFFKG